MPLSKLEEAFFEAVIEGDLQTLRSMLLVDPLFARARTHAGCTPWMTACFCNRGSSLGVLEALLPHSQKEAVCNRGQTALMVAAEKGAATVVRFLLPHVNPRLRDHSGKTALMIAAAGGFEECARVLLPVSNWAQTDRTGNTALDWAGKMGAWGCADLLGEVEPVKRVRHLLTWSKLNGVEAQLPRSRARLERLELRQALKPKPKSRPIHKDALPSAVGPGAGGQEARMIRGEGGSLSGPQQAATSASHPTSGALVLNSTESEQSKTRPRRQDRSRRL